MAFLEFPRHLHKSGGLWKEVRNHEEQWAALAEGWSLEPVTDRPEDSPTPEPPIARKTRKRIAN